MLPDILFDQGWWFLLEAIIYTEMKAVFSMDIKGTISTSCWQEISSSSGGVTETRRDCGSAMFFTDDLK